MCNNKDSRAMLRALTNELTRNHDAFTRHHVGNGFMHMQYYRTALVYHRMISDYFDDPTHHDRSCAACNDAHDAYDLFDQTITTVNTDPIA